MSDTTINLSRSTGLVSMGVHTFRVARISLSHEPGDSGYHFFFVNCECTDSGEDRGKEALLILSLSPKARFKLDEFLDAIEAPKDGEISAERFTKEFTGKYFRADIVHDDSRGKPQANMSNLLPASEQISSIPADTVERPPRRRAQPQEEEEDDTPF